MHALLGSDAQVGNVDRRLEALLRVVVEQRSHDGVQGLQDFVQAHRVRRQGRAEQPQLLEVLASAISAAAAALSAF